MFPAFPSIRLPFCPMKKTVFPEYAHYFDSPVGVIVVLYADDPFVLKRVLLPGERGYRDDPGAKAPIRPSAQKEVLCINRFFSAYFEKRPVPVPWDLLNFSGFTPLERLVWEKTADIPFGYTAAYSDIAMAIGRPMASRFTGSALGKNPFPIMIPCHRVIRKGGGLGGFGSGIDMKRKLLSFEGALLQPVLA